MNAAVERNKKILGGALVIKGTRVPVSRVLCLMAKGISLEEINKTYYPSLTIDELRNAIHDVADSIE